MTFASRQDAGWKLGEHLVENEAHVELVLGLPRGGVIVAAEVAKRLGCEFDVLVVRKLGHPEFREFAVGALGEGGVVVLDEAGLDRARVERKELATVIAEESRRLQEYQVRFARVPRPTRVGKAVVTVDDGLATGATMEAAVRSARQQGASRVDVAVPVASRNGTKRVQRICDHFYALLIDPSFQAVGYYYQSFAQATDEEVQAALND